MTVTTGKDLDLQAATALERGAGKLLALQDGDGWWKGDLETNVTMDAEDLLLREFLGIRGDERTKGAAAWIRSKQREDGTWATFHGGPPDLSTTIEAYVALRLAGDPDDAAHLRRAAAWIRDAGGIERSRVFTRIWLALFGLWDWEDLPVMPPEMILLPSWVPLNVYDFACWARQTIVPLTIVSTLRPVRPIGFGLSELRAGGAVAPLEPITTWTGRFQRLDRWLHAYHHRPIRPLRRMAMRRATRWIIERQEADGAWGGIQPPWVYSIMALHLLGYPLDHPVLQAGLRGLEGFTVNDGPNVWLEACQSPVWDTGLAVIALADAAWPPTTRRWCAPANGCSVRRCGAAATGPYGGRLWPPVAGRSSSPTTITRTSTTPPRSCSPSGGSPILTPSVCTPRSPAGSPG